MNNIAYIILLPFALIFGLFLIAFFNNSNMGEDR